MNKYQFERYQKIHDRIKLRSSQGATSDELMNLCGISKSQLKNDIIFLREEHDAPIKFDRKLKAYIYTSEFELANDLKLTRSDYLKLKVAFNTLSQFKHLDIYKDFEGIYYKIENSFRYQSNQNQNSSIHFEKVPYYKGTEHIELFLEGIENTQVIEFEYLSTYATEPLTHAFQPYFIKEHSNRWYAIGFLSKENSITTFALDRIINTPILSNQYYDIPQDFDVEKHYEFTYGIGVELERDIETVILEFQPTQARFFKSKPFHKFEIIQDDENKFIVEMQLRLNFELTRKLVSFGKGVKVLQPKSLRNTIIKYFKGALNQY
jgi:predicted DNA-binding transcriptional regulator YafY